MKTQKIISFLSEHKIVLAIMGLFFLFHFISITAPPLDTHAWRQADTAAVARNFAEESANIFYPRVDIRQEFSGITGMEFPLYNYTIFIVNKIFGYSHWIGRLISTIMGTIGIWFFYLLTKKVYNKTIAYYSSFVLAASPLFFYFSRNIQPDVTMVALSIISLYFAAKYSKTKVIWDYIYFLFFLSLSMLVKLPAIFIVPPALYLIYRNKTISLVEALLWIIVVLPNAAWYLHSNYLSTNFGLGNYYYEGLNLTKSLNMIETFDFWKHEFILRIASTVTTILGAILALFGLILVVIKKYYFVLLWLISIIIFLLLFSFKSYYHTYYSLPLTPVIALLAGVGIAFFVDRFLKSNLKYLIFLFIAAIIINLVVIVRPLYALNNQEYFDLENITSVSVPSNERVIVNGGPAPIMLYFSHRKGWTVENSQLTTETIDLFSKKGARYIIIDKDGGFVFHSNEEKIFDNDQFSIYRIGQ